MAAKLLYAAAAGVLLLAGPALAACPANADGVACDGHGECAPNGDVDLCQCVRGYGGADCSVTGCASPDCSGHGSCQDPAVDPAVEGDLAFCQCFAGFSGDDCATAEGECNPACVAGQGTCDLGTCVCNDEFAGPTCGDNACGPDQGCNGHGTCDTSGRYKCSCSEGFAGATCNAPSIACRVADCSGHGDCDSATGVCVCENGFIGGGCEKTACPKGCGNSEGKGACVNNVCICEAGFAGIDCMSKDCPNKCSVS